MIWIVLACVLGLAVIGNAMATPEQRADSRRLVKRIEPYAWGATALMIGFVIWAEYFY